MRPRELDYNRERVGDDVKLSRGGGEAANKTSGNAPQRNRSDRLRGSKERQKSKATKVSKSSKKATKGGRMGKALRKQAIGKALFTVEEWLRRG